MTPPDFCSTRNKTFSFKRRFIFSSPPPRFFNLPSSLRKEIMTRLRSTPMVDTHVTKMSTMRLKPLLNRICFLFVFSFFDRETWLMRSKEQICCCHCQVTIGCHQFKSRLCFAIFVMCAVISHLFASFYVIVLFWLASIYVQTVEF